MEMMGFGYVELLLLLLMMGLFLLLIGGAVAAIIWFSRRAGTGPAGGDSAQAILRERYARGELSREEFVRLRDELRE
jgi:putative membrane protein